MMPTIKLPSQSTAGLLRKTSRFPIADYRKTIIAVGNLDTANYNLGKVLGFYR